MTAERYSTPLPARAVGETENIPVENGASAASQDAAKARARRLYAAGRLIERRSGDEIVRETARDICLLALDLMAEARIAELPDGRAGR